MQKQCLQCHTQILKGTRSPSVFAKLKFCSTKCYHESLKGRTLSETTKRRISKNNGKYWVNKVRPDISKNMSIRNKELYSQGKIIGFKKCWQDDMNFMRGENNPRWISDRTKLKKRDKRNDPLYKEWRRNVCLRDGFVCKINNKDCCKKLEVHHILRWADYPELRYDINNGITLCKNHHPRKKKEEERLSPYFKELLLTLT
jgi:hypothetical protein